AQFVIDDLSQTLPPNPCMPASHKAIVFEGESCDGVSCPPGPLVTSSCAGASVTTQTGLSSVLQNASHTVVRKAFVGTNQSTHSVSATVNTALNRWQSSGDDPLGTISYLWYSAPGWNLNFPAMGVASVQVAVEGDITAAKPLYCWLELIYDDAVYRYGQMTVVMTAPGLVTFPIGPQFLTLNGF